MAEESQDGQEKPKNPPTKTPESGRRREGSQLERSLCIYYNVCWLHVDVYHPYVHHPSVKSLGRDVSF